MSYTGNYQLTVGSDGIVHSSADEAIEARNASDETGRYYAELCDSN